MLRKSLNFPLEIIKPISSDCTGGEEVHELKWRNAAGAVERRSRSGMRGKLPVWCRSGVMKVRSVELEVHGGIRS